MTISPDSLSRSRAADATPGATSVPDGSQTDSFEVFVLGTGARMHRAALLLCGGDHHLAEDLTQATYAKVFVTWGRVRRTEDPVAYTRTVLTRTYLSHRRLRRSSERPTDDLPDPPAPGSPGTRAPGPGVGVEGRCCSPPSSPSRPPPPWSRP